MRPLPQPGTEISPDPATPRVEFEWVPEAKVLVAIHVHGVVSDADWERYVSTLRSNLSPKLRCLVWNEGGRPTVSQQRRIVEVTRGMALPVAVVSSTIAVRFVVSVFSLANRHMRFFPSNEIEKALLYLCDDHNHRAAVRAALHRTGARAGVISALCSL